MNRRTCLLLAGSLLLTACATTPPAALPAREQIRDFALEARFALRVTRPEQAPQSSGGRLSWAHSNGEDRLMIANPLGIGLAEIEITPNLARLRTADGKHFESPDADSLIEEVTGQALPVTRLPAWLLGKANRETPVEKDAGGRPSRFLEAGWQIEYAYDDETNGALPARLNLNYGQEIELRLRIEQWKETP